MTHRIMTERPITLSAFITLFVLSTAVTALAQLPGGVSIPKGGLSKDSLLSEAKELLADLTSMKNSGKLAPDQMKQVDGLIPKAESLTSELGKPQVEASKLPQLASNLRDLQKQVGALKGLIK